MYLQIQIKEHQDLDEAYYDMTTTLWQANITAIRHRREANRYVLLLNAPITKEQRIWMDKSLIIHSWWYSWDEDGLNDGEITVECPECSEEHYIQLKDAWFGSKDRYPWRS